MKILDATIVIAIFKEISRPDLIDKILQLNHDLVIPNHMMERELLDEITIKKTKEFVDSKKLVISKLNAHEEIIRFQEDYPKVGFGESDVILTYQKMKKKEQTVYCILDDKNARKVATELGIKFGGLIKILELLKERSIVNQKEITSIMDKLKKSSFRISDNLSI